MDWLVKNAQNRDVERQHLNKILQEIRNTLNEFEARMARDSSEEARIRAIVVKMLTTGAQSGINVTYNTTSKAIDFTVRTFTIQLTGDVTGTATVTGLGNVSINTTLTAENEGVEEAPLDGQYYWRSSGAWITVPTPLQTIDIFEGAGILVLDNDYNWFGRSIEGVAGEIEVTDGDGIAGNPSVGLADVVPGVGGELIKLSFDVKGRRFEEAPVTAADLTPLLDPYYEPLGAAAAALTAANVYTDVAIAAFNASANTWALTQTFTVAPVFTDQAGSRAALDAVGINATENIGGTKTFTNSILFDATTTNLRPNTVDGSDTKAINVLGGGATGVGRGSRVSVHGNEHATNPGIVEVVAGNAASARIRYSGAEECTAIVSPSSVATDRNDWNATGFPAARVIRATASAPINVSGIVPTFDNRRLLLINVGSNNLTLTHESASSAAANRFLCPASTAVVLTPNASVELFYDATLTRWFIIGAGV